MDLLATLREHLARLIIPEEDQGWHAFIYDTAAAHIIRTLYTPSELMEKRLITVNHIDEARPPLDFPAVYFVACTRAIAKQINRDIADQKYQSALVYSLIPPTGLNAGIPAVLAPLRIEALGSRHFICAPTALPELCAAMNMHAALRPHASALDSTHAIEDAFAQFAGSTPVRSEQESPVPTAVILIDRSADPLTPFIHFFSFKAAVAELDPDNPSRPDFKDPLWTSIAHRHLGEVSAELQLHVAKLNKNMELLERKDLDTGTLKSLVVGAARNRAMKEAVGVHATHLSAALQRLESIKPLVEAEQAMATGFEVDGRRARRAAEQLFRLLENTQYPLSDRLRLLYIMKLHGAEFTRTETDILAARGFKKEDVCAQVNSRAVNRPSEPVSFKYDVSRYEPLIARLVKQFVDGQDSHPVRHIDSRVAAGTSLRRSRMISLERKLPKRAVVVYILGGMTVEESRLAYSLAEDLGIDVLVGSDKHVTFKDFIKSKK